MSQDLDEVTTGGLRGSALVRLGTIPALAAARWEAASKQDGVALVDTHRFADCVSQAIGSRPVCIVTTPGALDDASAMARILDPDDPAFRRVAVILIVGDRPQDELAARTVWGTIRAEADSREVDATLRAAFVAAERRLSDWEEADDFHRRHDTLTRDESEVLEAVCDGKLNKQIAADLGISIRTVEQRRRRVFNKMGVDSAVPLARKIGRVEALERHVLRQDPAHWQPAGPTVMRAGLRSTGAAQSAETPVDP